VERIEAQGGIAGKFSGPRGEGQVTASSAALEVAPKTQQPTELRASGNVFAELRTKGKNAATRRLKTEELLVHFSGGAGRQNARMESAETALPAMLEWQAQANPAGIAGASMRLVGQRMNARFNASGQAESMQAEGGAEVERALPGQPAQKTTSRELRASFGADGDWTEMDLNGDVKIREGERTAQAEQAQMRRSNQTAVLTGNATVSDATTRTTAQKISFAQATGEIRAEGQVRSSDLAAGGNGVNLAPQPAHISAEHLTANSKTGQALYSGHARLWQGDSVVEADSIELLRDAKRLNAKGNVVAVFPQTATGPRGGGPSAKPAKTTAGPAGPGAGGRSLWRISAGAMSYSSAEGRAHLQEGVDAKSQQGEIEARALDVYFSAGAEGGQGKQLSRAVATGGVTVRQEDRTGTAERGEYSAAEGKFVLSGGSPTLTDASRGTTTGRQLTFFLADDTIVVDSENGSRTLTKHRVEK
jgi:lipopolysaccharide export system protein LptA